MKLLWFAYRKYVPACKRDDLLFTAIHQLFLFYFEIMMMMMSYTETKLKPESRMQIEYRTYLYICKWANCEPNQKSNNSEPVIL
jgi:hypothetical protein